MTHPKATIQNTIRIMKLVSGEEIITEVMEGEQQFALEYTLINPCMILTQQTGVALIPFMPYLNPAEGASRTFPIQKMHVMYQTVADERFAKSYYDNYGSGRVKASPILTPKKAGLQLVTSGNGISHTHPGEIG